MSTSPAFKPIPEPTRKIRVNPGQSIQTALVNLKEGEAIELEAGGTYVQPITTLVHPFEKHVQFISSNPEFLPEEGERFNPSVHIAPIILSPQTNLPALFTTLASHHYIFSGIDFGAEPGKAIDELIRFGANSDQKTLESVPHNLILDRCRIQGHKSNITSKRGISLNSSKTTIQNCHISNFHISGHDSQAICGWNGPGDFDILNNYIEGAGENLMIGGSQTFIPGLVPTNINILWNDFVKPLSWRVGDPSYDGIRRSIKNHLELKTGRRVHIEANRFKNCWMDAQNGVAIVFKTSNESSGQAYSITEEVDFINNIVEGAAGGVDILGRQDPDTDKTNRIRIANTLFLDINGPKWGSSGMGRLFQILGGPRDIIINHCTAFQSNHAVVLDGEPSSGFTYANNITPHNDYGIFGSGKGPGKLALDYYFPGSLVKRNILAGGLSRLYPSDNFFPASLDEVGFVSRQSGDFRLHSTSPFKNQATDGSDVGVNFDELERAFILPVINPPVPPINPDIERLIELHREMGDIINRL
jgi:hypothetical protein